MDTHFPLNARNGSSGRGAALCPDCGSPRMRITSVVTVEYEVTRQPEDLHVEVICDSVGDADWDSDSPASCSTCNWQGRVGQLLKPF